MTLHVCVLGIDGSGKSTVVASLPAVLAACGTGAGAAGESFQAVTPEEDNLVPGFYPEGLPLSARLAKRLKALAKRNVDHRRLYPLLKLAQMLCQDDAAFRIGRKFSLSAVVSDGNLLLSSAGRAANYLRPASDGDVNAHAGPEPVHLAAAFAFLTGGAPLSAVAQARLPRLDRARALVKALRALRLNGVWLPDFVVFLDLPPRAALERIALRGNGADRHENENDLAQAREMYLRTLAAFAQLRGQDAVLRIPAEAMSPGEILKFVASALKPRLLAANPSAAAGAPLGTSAGKLTKTSVWSKVLHPGYLSFLIRKSFDGAWREPLFLLSGLGRMFLKEGYSAGMMCAIYDRDLRQHGLLDRIFLEYPLHRAVYDRLQILTTIIEPEMERRLREREELHILTAPSGFAYDLFRPLEAIAARNPQLARRVRIVAADLDPYATVEPQLSARAAKLGVAFEFIRGDLTSAAVRRRLFSGTPVDLALFVGLSSWLPKPGTTAHLRSLHDHLRSDGLLITDCFTPHAYSLSGRYAGFQANYYQPGNYRAIADSCGFDGLSAECQSGRDGINHVLVFRRRASAANADGRNAPAAAARI